jgi:hypothetical protein
MGPKQRSFLATHPILDKDIPKKHILDVVKEANAVLEEFKRPRPPSQELSETALDRVREEAKKGRPMSAYAAGAPVPLEKETDILRVVRKVGDKLLHKQEDRAILEEALGLFAPTVSMLLVLPAILKASETSEPIPPGIPYPE